jgi:hypothetical protein
MKKVAGIGIYEKGKYPASITLNGETTQTKAYKDWVNLCSFCGSESYLTQSPSYVGKILDQQWIKFQDFAEWHSENHREGWVLSTSCSNLIGPDTSFFVPREVMQFINPRKKPMVVTKTHVKLSMTLQGVECTFGKYRNIPDAMMVYSGLFLVEITRLIKEYALSEWLGGKLKTLANTTPNIRYAKNI